MKRAGAASETKRPRAPTRPPLGAHLGRSWARSWALGWPLVVALQALLFTLVAALGGYGAAWIAVALIALVIGGAPWLARRQLRSVVVAGPARATLQAGLGQEVVLAVQGAGRDLLLRFGAPARLERTRVTAVPDLAALIGAHGAEAARVSLELRLNQRGKWSELTVALATTFPFGLCEARATRVLACDLIVRPRPLRSGAWLREVLRRERGDGSGDLLDPVGEFYALRDWRPGESTRRIAAGASLRRGRFVRVESASAAPRPARVVLATGLRASAAAFERSVSAAATLVTALGRSGRRVEFGLLGGDEEGAVCCVGVSAALDTLAAIGRAAPSELEGFARAAARQPDGALLVAGLDTAPDDGALRSAWPGAVLVLCLPAGDPVVFDHAAKREGPTAATRRRGELATPLKGAARALPRASTGGQRR